MSKSSTAMMAVAGLVALLAISACGDDGLGDAPDAGATASPDAAGPPDAGAPDAGPTYEDADWLFESDRVLTVEIEMAADDWDRLRFQTRNILELLGEECATKPAYSPFTYFPATVTVDGERIAEVGVRKKGFLGSLDDVKPSLKIKLDEYVADQSLSGLTRMTLNNSKQDPSYLDQCLGYRLFANAGVPAPRCNFATVSVNGESLGVYVHVESVKKPFLARHFDDNDGNLYEGTLSDFRDGWTATFERKTNESNPPGTEDTSDIQAVVAALALDDAAMLTELERLVDLERFFGFWAVEALVSHWDGYAGNNNNFFLYGDPVTGKLVFMPWGTDQLFGDGGEQGPGLTRSALTRRLFLYEPSRERYLARFEQILDEVWDDAEMLAEVDRLVELVGPLVPAEELAAFADGVTTLRMVFDGWEGRMREALAAAGPEQADPLAAPMCFVDHGGLTATFSVAYGGGGAPMATLSVTIDGTPVALGAPAVFAGQDEDPARSVLYLVAERTPTQDVIAFVTVPHEQVVPGVVAVGSSDVEAALVLTTEGVEEPDAVYFMSGTMTLDSGAPSVGSVWSGELDLRLWRPPWF